MSETRTITPEQLAAALKKIASHLSHHRVYAGPQTAARIFAVLPASPSLVSGAAAPDSLDVERLAKALETLLLDADHWLHGVSVATAKGIQKDGADSVTFARKLAAEYARLSEMP